MHGGEVRVGEWHAHIERATRREKETETEADGERTRERKKQRTGWQLGAQRKGNITVERGMCRVMVIYDGI